MEQEEKVKDLVVVPMNVVIAKVLVEKNAIFVKAKDINSLYFLK
ncbi:MAG: hypothetical protein PHN88_04575 [Ignavibacteria bacterium]|nr:hypothetical protein [Ignavibacteria bacterium]